MLSISRRTIKRSSEEQNTSHAKPFTEMTISSQQLQKKCSTNITWVYHRELFIFFKYNHNQLLSLHPLSKISVDNIFLSCCSCVLLLRMCYSNPFDNETVIMTLTFDFHVVFIHTNFLTGNDGRSSSFQRNWLSLVLIMFEFCSS